MGKAKKPPEETKFSEPAGPWVEPLLESVIELYSGLIDMDFPNDMKALEKDVPT